MESLTIETILEKILCAQAEGVPNVRICFKSQEELQGLKIQIETLALAEGYTLRRAASRDVAIWIDWGTERPTIGQLVDDWANSELKSLKDMKSVKLTNSARPEPENVLCFVEEIDIPSGAYPKLQTINTLGPAGGRTYPKGTSRPQYIHPSPEILAYCKLREIEMNQPMRGPLMLKAEHTLSAKEALEKANPYNTWPSKAAAILGHCTAAINAAVQHGRTECEINLRSIKGYGELSQRELDLFSGNSPTVVRIVTTELSKLGYNLMNLTSEFSNPSIQISWLNTSTNWWPDATRLIAEYQDGKRTLLSPNSPAVGQGGCEGVLAAQDKNEKAADSVVAGVPIDDGSDTWQQEPSDPPF